MQRIHTGKYILIDELNISGKIVLKAYWKNDHLSMSDNIYRNEIKELIKLVKDKNPQRMLGDMQNFIFTISPETQMWLNEHLFGVYIEQKIDKLAMILSKDLFSQISIEQTIEEEDTFAFQTKYFDNLDEAFNWLQY